ncbi:MAG: hypothetical protein JST16_05080 [Bdellovibrionales bacterium]|nr:hypothetical protein [Bdellovibrionales bacterium]
MDKEKLRRFLVSSTTDRIISISLGGYWLYQSVQWTAENRKGWPLMTLIVSSLVQNLLIAFRRKPESISLKPAHWFIAMLACYWWLLFGGFSNQGQSLVAKNVTDALSTVGLVLVLSAKLSLWRSFGIVPAKRKLQTTGLYSIVRHPIYGMWFLFLNTSFLLSSFSLVNLAITSGSIAASVGQALAEEDFFKNDLEYRAYRARVKKRFIPFVV